VRPATQLVRRTTDEVYEEISARVRLEGMDGRWQCTALELG
jgi:hypothetical protein